MLLLSARGAAGSVGPAWFAAVVDAAKAAYPEASLDGLLDCAGTPGYAVAALRQGLKRICYDGAAFDAIADIAAQGGAILWRERPPALDLAAVADDDGPEAMAALVARCRDWLLA